MVDAQPSFKQRLVNLPILGGFFSCLAAIKNAPKIQQLCLQQAEKIKTLELQTASLEALKPQTATLEALEQQRKSLNQRQLNLKMNLARTLAQKQDRENLSNTPPPALPLADDLDNLYIAFEDQFRGTAEEIRQQQVKYLPFLSAIAQTINEPLKLLDIGCGRGEWLRLLAEHHYEACGIDISQTMTDVCRLDGLNVAQGDALIYLAKQADCSLHAISAFHVIEHVSFEYLVALFDECLRVLKPGGKIIFETPNPENLTVGAYSFYLDPTHKNPLPPVTIEFIARQRGFSHVDIFRYNPREDVGEDTPLKQQWFCSPVDFAVIAEK